MSLDIPGFEGTLEQLENLIPTKCSKCGKIPAEITYNDKKYCTWYCAKKG